MSIHIRSLVLSITLLLFTLGGIASAREPLLIPGKKSLYERVLTRPGAELVAQPSTTGGKLVDAFSRYYVYARSADGAWIEVGADTRGDVKGWIRADQTEPWRHQLIVAFTDRAAGRERVLFFNSSKTLGDLIEASDPGLIVRPLIDKIVSGGEDPRVVAIEPDNFVDIDDPAHFYLLPILDFEERYTFNYDQMYLLRVAAVTETAPQAPQAPRSVGPFRAGIVFVIDSTISMDQYIERAKQAVVRVYEKLRQSSVYEMVRFGLVSYRAASSDPEKARRLGYVAKEFVDPTEVKNESEFLTRAKGLTEADVSTDFFDEDAYAGVMEAIDGIDWSHFGARFIVLISDAGALKGEQSKTRLQADQVASEAAAKGIAVYAIHLKTPEGKKDHAKAEGQYRRLAANKMLQQPLYFPIDAGSGPSFTQQVNALGDSVLNLIERAARGERVAGSASSVAPVADPTDRIRQLTQALGYAMQLRYFGKQGQTQVPEVFDGWIADRDLIDPSVQAVDVRVLLTRVQLSNLSQGLERIVNALDRSMLEPGRFFFTLQMLAGQTTRDPNRSLGDLGLLEEYLVDLPYKSKVLSLSPNTWSSWGVQKRQAFVLELKSKIEHYKIYDRDRSRWKKLSPDAGPDALVYPVPLSDLP